MPDQKTTEKAREDAMEGKSPSTQAGEFVHEEIEHVRKGKHGARSTKQAIAIGLSKARRAGVKLPAPKASKTSPATRRKAQRDAKKANQKKKPSAKRSRATKAALRREGTASASKTSLARQARSSAKGRSKKERSKSAQKAARTRTSRRKNSR